MQVRYSAKRPSQVALLSAKNKNLRLQFAPKLGNKRFKIFCLMLKSWLLLHNSNFRQKQHESMAPSYHVHLYIATGYTSSDGCFRQDNTPCQKLRSTQTGFLNMAMISLYSHQISVQKSACRISLLLSCQYEAKPPRNFSRIFLNLYHEDEYLRQFWRQRLVSVNAKMCNI